MSDAAARLAEVSDTALQLGLTFGHEPSEVHGTKGFTGQTCCGNCFTNWPCATVRKIERVMVPVVRSLADLRAAEALVAAAAAIDVDARVRKARNLGQAQRVAGEARSVVLEAAAALRGEAGR